MKKVPPLDNLLMTLVDDWYALRREDPDEYPWPHEVASRIWDNDVVVSDYAVHEGSNSFTIADVVKDAVDNIYGGLSWDEMDEHVKSLTNEERDEMDLSSFIETLAGILNSNGYSV